MAALFRLEKSRDLDTVRHAITNLIEWLKLPGQKGLRSTFTRWIYKVYIQTRYPKEKLPEVENLEEARTMLSKTVAEWTRQWKQEGLKKGLEEGREKGREEGREEGRELLAKLVLRQIEAKLGPLNKEDRRRVLSAKEPMLLKWGENLITATSVKDIFKH